MSSSPTVVVQKGGVLCGAGLGFYALNMADRKVGDFIRSGKTLLEVVPELRESLGMVTDLLNDHRTPEYRAQLEAAVKIARAGEDRFSPLAVVEVANKGDQTVTYLTARVVVSDAAGVPLHEYRTFVATPVQINEHEWRGPILPGATRRYSLELRDAPTGAGAAIELTDVRTWNGQRPASEMAPTPAPTESP
jgi:hypothetical protein